MRRVLMVSPHFPPDTSAGAHRVRLLAPYLESFGWEPTVVTVDPAGYEGRLDPELAALVAPTLRILRAPAWSVETTRSIGLGDLGLRALTGLHRVCNTVLGREHFDAFFVTMYPTYPAVLGPLMKARHGVPFVLDYQDPWVGAWGLTVGGSANGSADVKSRLTRAVAGRLEPLVVRRADALTAVSARTYEDVLLRVPDARPRTCAAIPLGHEEADFAAVRRAHRPNPYFDTADGLIHVCYVGTVLPTGTSVVRAVLRALRDVRSIAPAAFRRLRLHFLGTSNQRDPSAPQRVIPMARELGVESAVREIAPRLDYLDAINVQLEASALLLMGSLEPHYTPSKVFPALLAGRPIVAAYHKASSALDILRSHGAAVSVATFSGESDVADVAGPLTSALVRLAAESGAIRPSHVPDIEEWSARSQARRLAQVFDEVAR